MYRFGDVIICKDIRYDNDGYIDNKSRPYLVLSTSKSQDESINLKCLHFTTKIKHLGYENNLMLSSILSNENLNILICDNIVNIPENKILGYLGHINDFDKNNVIKKLMRYYEKVNSKQQKGYIKGILKKINKQYQTKKPKQLDDSLKEMLQNLPYYRPQRKRKQHNGQTLRYKNEENI